MKIFYVLLFQSLFQSTSAKNNFISDSQIDSITFSTGYVYLSLDIQNSNILKTLYLNNDNNLYSDNMIQVNQDIILNKLPQFTYGDVFLVLDQNNQLGMYNALKKGRSTVVYDTVLVNNILPIEKTDITIQNIPKYNISFNIFDQFYCYGKFIFLNGSIKTNNSELLISSLNKTNMISIPNQIITSGDIEYNGLSFSVDNIYSKKFFSLNNNIIIFSPIEFQNSFTLKNSNQPTSCIFEKNSIISLNRNLICNNIPVVQPNLTIALIGLNENNNPTFINTDTTTLESTTNIYAQSETLTIGDNTYLVNISAQDYQQKNYLKLQKWKTDTLLLRPLSDTTKCNFNTLETTNLFPTLNGKGLSHNKYLFYGNGKVSIEKVNFNNDIHFQNKETPIMLVTSNTQLLDISSLPTNNTFTSEIKQVVLINTNGVLGYINQPGANEKHIMIPDSLLLKTFLPLYTTLKSQLKSTKNINTDFITLFIKEYLQNDSSTEVIDNLFQYNEKNDELAYNPIFAKELLNQKINSLEDFSLKTISTKKIKIIEEELEEALIKITNFIEKNIGKNNL